MKGITNFSRFFFCSLASAVICSLLMPQTVLAEEFKEDAKDHYTDTDTIKIEPVSTFAREFINLSLIHI